ncbi:DUF4270 family protein [Niabella beijingensis]|uniref:DUF4270 family protein n=1 Tax=Niabella beijingensis TaxID=2872700 RepID=UPI001CC17ED4|nr:DUF4270 family protein [Niabella beijingensis]MBZ4191433.1 DUF4270 domain-containing protein [Niabella beijingensis]
MKFKYLFLLLIIGTGSACTKTDILFKDNTNTADPNITYWDNYTVALSTYKLDTFATTGDSLFVIGTQNDPRFGRINALSFAELTVPTENPLWEQRVTYDSAAILLQPNGNYYGDTTRPFRINAHKLTENIGIDVSASTTYYNPAKTGYDNSLLGSYTGIVYPGRKDTVRIKLADDFGADLFNQIKNKSAVIEDQTTFRNYLKGIALVSDSNYSQAVYQFAAGTGLLRIYYTLRGQYNEKKFLDIGYTASKQYNHLGYNYAGTPLASFNPLKSQLTESSAMDRKALLNNYIPSYIKITFPDILDVKQAYPYVKVIKAALEVRVNKQENTAPFTLPPGLVMYISNLNNEFSSVLLQPGSTDAVQNGNLVINDLEENGTKYTFDITSYINTIIDEGRFSTKSLFLCPYSTGYKTYTSRLVVTDQPNDSDIKLKLYVLGL